MDLRNSALTIFRAALDAADPRLAIRRAMRRDGNILRVRDAEYDLSRARRVFVVGCGKASAAMAQAVEQILGDRIDGSGIVVKYGHTAPLNRIQLYEAGHPLPDENSLRGTQKILDVLAQATQDDLVLCLISGGGSALLELPISGVSLDDMRSMTDVMLRAGATINELNTLRKHLSQVKGGQLARRANGAQIFSLILSDVLGSTLDTIASGPTAPDSTTFADACNVIEQRGVRQKLPAVIVQHLEQGRNNEIADTPKSNDPIFVRVQNAVIADNTIACDAAIRSAQSLGFNTLFLTSYLQGEASQVAKTFAAIAKEICATNRPVARPACIIAGGETTVTVRGNGIGGRNQELALAAAIEIAGMPNIVVLSGGTDGNDGPCDATGALADSKTVARAIEHEMDAQTFLAKNDSYNFFKPLGDLIITGPTNTNVNDITLLLVE